MGRLGTSILQVLDTRHPGLLRKVDAMLESFATIKAVEAMIQADYGERIGHSTIWSYKRRIWKVRRDGIQAAIVDMIAYQEFVSEGRN
jgi:hypothetical protein